MSRFGHLAATLTLALAQACLDAAVAALAMKGGRPVVETRLRAHRGRIAAGLPATFGQAPG